MADAEPDWSLYRALLAVLDTGSLSRAADALGLAQPTVGRQIAALEAGLGAGALFTRSPSGLKPTEAALALEPHARAMSAAAGALRRVASGDGEGLSGVVRLTAAEIVASDVLPDILTAFREAHPKVAIELSVSNRQEDLLRRDADLAVRMVRPTQGALLARRIGEVKLHLYAHRSYAERHGLPTTIAEVGAHSVIGFDREAPPPSVMSRLPVTITRDFFSLRCDSNPAQLAFLRAGFGLCFCQTTIARGDPDLIPVLSDLLEWPLEYWVVMHEDLKGVRRMRALFDALVEGLGSYIAG